MNTRKIQLLEAAIKLAEKSNSFTQFSRLQTASNMDIAAQMIRRAYLQQKASFRLMKWAGLNLS